MDFLLPDLTGVFFVLPLQLEENPREIRNMQKRLGQYMMKFRYKKDPFLSEIN